MLKYAESGEYFADILILMRILEIEIKSIPFVYSGNLTGVQGLVAEGVNVSATVIVGNNRWTPLYVAVARSKFFIRLHQNGFFISLEFLPLFFPDHEDIVRYLIEKGATVDPLDRNNKTPLHPAAARSNSFTYLYSCFYLSIDFRILSS